MRTFSDWLKMRESSAATRLKTQAALGLAPPVADIFSRSTPPPWQVERLTKSLKDSHSAGRKKKKKKKKSNKRSISEASKPMPVSRDLDSFITAVDALAKDLFALKELMKKPKPKSKAKSVKKTEDKLADKKTSKKVAPKSDGDQQRD